MAGRDTKNADSVHYMAATMLLGASREQVERLRATLRSGHTEMYNAVTHRAGEVAGTPLPEPTKEEKEILASWVVSRVTAPGEPK